MPESLIINARHAVAAAEELADLCAAQMHLEEPEDWPAFTEEMRRLVRVIDRGVNPLVAILAQQKPVN